MDSQVLVKIVILASIVEAIVQTIKPIYEPEKRTPVFFVSLATGFVAAIGVNYLAGLDIFAAVGIPLTKAPIVGVILTGILMSRGANVVHDLLAMIEKFKKSAVAIFSNKGDVQ